MLKIQIAQMLLAILYKFFNYSIQSVKMCKILF